MEEILNFTENDISLFNSKNITVNKVQEQIHLFEKGVKFSDLDRACTPNDGILVLSNNDVKAYADKLDALAQNKHLMKFVPASGAASRMFKHLHAYSNGDQSELVDQFMNTISSFAFYNELKANMEQAGKSLETCLSNKDYESIIHCLLSEEA